MIGKINLNNIAFGTQFTDSFEQKFKDATGPYPEKHLKEIHLLNKL